MEFFRGRGISFGSGIGLGVRRGIGLGLGRGTGIGAGRVAGGRGRMGGIAAGPGGICKCPKCGYEEQQVTGEPCMYRKCPKCGAKMIRG